MKLLYLKICFSPNLKYYNYVKRVSKFENIKIKNNWNI